MTYAWRWIEDVDVALTDGKGISLADTRAALTSAMGKLTPPVTLAGLVDCR